SIAAFHARAATSDATDWPRIAELYAELAAVQPSPVVELNRAVAVGMAQGPAAGLALVDALADEPSLQRYYLLPPVRAERLERLGRHEEARSDFEGGASMTGNARERDLLLKRAQVAHASAQCHGGCRVGQTPGLRGTPSSRCSAEPN